MYIAAGKAYTRIAWVFLLFNGNAVSTDDPRPQSMNILLPKETQNHPSERESATELHDLRGKVGRW